MGAEQDDAYAARRAELDQRFAALPMAGGPAYWQAIETPTSATSATALPLEVLGRCLRERLAAGERDESGRIFAAIVRRVQVRVAAWAHRLAQQAPAERAEALAQDLEQECYLALWRELIAEDDTFLLELFPHALDRIQRHTAHAVMEREGLWRRPGVQTPTRVPHAETERLDRPERNEEISPVSAQIFDSAAEDAFERVELENDIRTLLDTLPSEGRNLLYDYFWRELEQDEIARHLGVTDRTVRSRLKRLYDELRRRLTEPQEDANG